jgi:hypothetical protein
MLCALNTDGRCGVTPDALGPATASEIVGKEGIFTNLGDSCLLLELFGEVFVVLKSRQSMSYKSVLSRIERKAKRNGEQRVYTPHRLDPSLARAEETIRSSINMGIYIHKER